MSSRNLTAKRKSFLHTIFTTAVEGGINYWAGVDKYHHSINGRDDLDGFYAVICDLEDDEAEPVRIDIDAINRGVDLFVRYCHGEIDYHGREIAPQDRKPLLADHYWNQFLEAEASDGDDGDYDAEVADQILQFGAFGEAVYG